MHYEVSSYAKVQMTSGYFHLKDMALPPYITVGDCVS